MKGIALLLLCAAAAAQASPICTQEMVGVMLPHPKCDHFYTCFFGSATEQYCGDGLLFNPDLQVCDWPFNVDCGDRIIPPRKLIAEKNTKTDNRSPAEICAEEGSEDLLLDHEYCDKYYKCNNGKPVTMPCPPNLLWLSNRFNQFCYWADQVDCGDRIRPEGFDQEPDDGVNDNLTPAEIFCNQPGTWYIVFAHENCNQYYQCISGKPILMSCPSPLVFNLERGFCDWPVRVNCQDRIIPDDISGDGGNDDLTPAEIFCNQPGTLNIIFAHENCNQYYQCFFGKPLELSCPANLFYDLERHICDWPENVNCNNRIKPDGISSGNPNDDDKVSEQVSGGNSDPSQAPAICAAENSDGVLVAHENCNQFYKCFDGQPVALDCPQNLLYNPEKEYCDWEWNVNCGNRIKPDDISSGNPSDDKGPEQISGGNSDPSQAPAICAAEDSDGVLVAHENCNQFYKCFDGQPVALDCPQNLLYNPEKEYCDWEWNVNCGNRIKPDDISSGNPSDDKGPEQISGGNSDPSQAPAICAAEDSDGVLVAHENCNQFYKCFEGKPAALDCPQNLLYNPEKEYCDWEWNVDCGNRIKPDDVSNGNSNEDPDQGSGGNSDPSQAPAICAAEDSDGVLVAHENCNQFYKCSEGKPAALDCPQNLLYNPEKEYCDWPWNVDCGNRVIPSEIVIAENKI